MNTSNINKIFKLASVFEAKYASASKQEAINAKLTSLETKANKIISKIVNETENYKYRIQMEWWQYPAINASFHPLDYLVGEVNESLRKGLDIGTKDHPNRVVLNANDLNRLNQISSKLGEVCEKGFIHMNSGTWGIDH
jgi:hypothetical protein